MKTKLAQAKVTQTRHPFVAIKTKKRKKKKQSKKGKENFTPKRKNLKNDDLD
jgi:rRNA processing protein Gar1